MNRLLFLGLSFPIALGALSACNGLIGLREPTELCPATTITGLSGIADVVLAERSVYVIANNADAAALGQALYRVSTCDGSRSIVLDAARPPLAIDATSVFVLTPTGIKSLPLAPSGAATLVVSLADRFTNPPPAPQTWSIAADGTSVFWTEDVTFTTRSRVLTHSLGADPTASSIMWEGTGPLRMAADDPFVYAAESATSGLPGSPGNKLWSVPKSGGQARLVATGVGGPPPVAHGGFVYWVGVNLPSDREGTLYRAPSAADGGTEVVVASPASAFAVAGADVYFTSRESGELRRATLGQSGSAVVASQLPVMNGIAADATRVCWWTDSSIVVFIR